MIIIVKAAAKVIVFLWTRLLKLRRNLISKDYTYLNDDVLIKCLFSVHNISVNIISCTCTVLR